MAQSCDINEVPPDDETPSVEHETERAKLYLRKFCPEAGDSLYDHLSEVLSKILAERPKNALASFDEYSKKLRDDKFRSQNDRLRGLYEPPPQYKDAKKLINLFKVSSPIDDDDQSLEEGNEDVDKTKKLAPNLFDLFYYFEQADIGLPRAEIVLLNLSIRKLIANTKIEDVRFWGKFLGRTNNYYVVEASLSENEIERRLQELERKEHESIERESVDIDEKGIEQEDAEKKALESAMATKLSDLAEENETESVEEDDTLKLVFPPIPKNTWKPLPEVSPEPLGTGVNAKVYFVCNSPGLDDWVELPMVTPQQIVVARQIVHLFTGNLETQIHTFPPFPGSEKNYLRAQIARIGAATHISPIGYFTFGNEEQEDEEMEENEEEEEVEEGEVVKNRRYEPPPLKDLIDPSMSSWCHHSPHILRQGRVSWLAPGKANNEDDEDEDGEEEEEEEGEKEEDEDEDESERGEEGRDKGFAKEIGPPLLTPLSEDAATGAVTPWTARLSSRILQPDAAVALIRSNVWPGAFAIAADKKFANLYIGWGHKHQAHNYGPPAMPAIQEQCPVDSEITEIRDPSFDEEEAYRLAHLPPADDAEEQEDEESEEGDSDNDGED